MIYILKKNEIKDLKYLIENLTNERDDFEQDIKKLKDEVHQSKKIIDNQCYEIERIKNQKKSNDVSTIIFYFLYATIKCDSLNKKCY